MSKRRSGDHFGQEFKKRHCSELEAAGQADQAAQTEYTHLQRDSDAQIGPEAWKAARVVWRQSRPQQICTGGASGSGSGSSAPDEGQKRPLRSATRRRPRVLRGLSYKEVLGTNKSFKDPIPLVDMVEFLVNVWELEGVF